MEQLQELYMEKAIFSVMFHEHTKVTYNDNGTMTCHFIFPRMWESH